MSLKFRCKKCGVVIQSKSQHDFVACKCGNFIDGGDVYLRMGGTMSDLEQVEDD